MFKKKNKMNYVIQAKDGNKNEKTRNNILLINSYTTRSVNIATTHYSTRVIS